MPTDLKSFATRLLFAATALNAALAAAEDIRTKPVTQTLAMQGPIAANISVPSALTSALALGAPPRDSEAESRRIFDPVAVYLSQMLGRPVVYRHAATWSNYRDGMQNNAYDIVFDGPHFNGWRIRNRNHHVLVKLSGELVFTAVVRAENSRATQLKRLAGHKICSPPPPNLGALILFSEFDNPARQPLVVARNGYDAVYASLLKDECEAAVLPQSYLQQREGGNPRTRIIFQTESMPEQALSAGPRVSPMERAKITAALLSPAAEIPMAGFRNAYGAGRPLIAAQNTEYEKLSVFLRDEFGFY